MSKQITRRCEWNRYCFFIGEFHSERLLEIGRGRPQLVGRCDSCGGYVCNRCASCRSVEGLPGYAWQLLCPLDREPLGRGDEWIVFSAHGAGLNRLVGTPRLSALYAPPDKALASGVSEKEFQDQHAPLVTALQLVEAGQYAKAIEACELACKLTPDHAVMWLVRLRAFEKTGQLAAAWTALRNFLGATDEKLCEGIVELGWLQAESGVPMDYYAERFFALRASRDKGLRENLSLLLDNTDSTSETDPVVSVACKPLCAFLASMPPRDQIQLGRETPQAHLRARSLLAEQYGRVMAEFIAEDAQSTLIVLCHEYGVSHQQQNVYRQLEHILQKEPSVPILVEGFSGPRAKPVMAMDNREDRLAKALNALEQEGTLASDLLISLYPDGANIRGVDDARLLALQTSEAELVVNSLRTTEPHVLSVDFTVPAVVLDNLELKAYGAEIQKFHELQAELHQNKHLNAYLRKVSGLINNTGISMDQYPSTFAFIKALELEDELDFNAVEQERLALAERLGAKSVDPITPEKAATLDRWLEQATPGEEALVPLYPNMVEVTKPKPKPQKKSRWWWPFKFTGATGPKESEAGDPAWFQRLLILSIALRDKIIPDSYYHYRLDGLLDCLGIEIPAQSHLPRYMEYLRLASLIDVSTIAAFERPVLESALRFRLCRSSEEYGACQLRQELEDLVRLIRLRLPADRGRQLEGGKPRFAQWASDALRLEAYLSVSDRSGDFVISEARSFTARHSVGFDNTLTKAIAYYGYALHRSEKLIKNALDVDLNDVPIKVLVCGRFHLYEVLRALDHTPRLSLIVTAPFPKHFNITEDLKRAEWKAFSEEDGMPNSPPQ